MVSKNIILLIHTEADINSKCSSSAETAMLKCPKELSLLNDERKFESEFHSIILYSELHYTLTVTFISNFLTKLTK